MTLLQQINKLINTFEDSCDDLRRIDISLMTYYTKMSVNYVTEHHKGKFIQYCRNNGFFNDIQMAQELCKPYSQCKLVLFDNNNFPFAFDMELNEKYERIYNILWSFYKDGSLHLDEFITKRTPKTLCLNLNRQSLIYGYIHKYSSLYIPSDIITNCIIQFYDNSIIWNIHNDEMKIFLTSQYKNTIYGPKFEIIDGMEFEITCCPKGWKVKGNVQCYLELRKFPNYIKDITITFTLFVKQTEYEYKKTVIYYKNGKRKAHGWSQHAMKFEEIKNNNFNELHIGCCVDIIHIRFMNTFKYRNIITNIPTIDNIQLLEWDVNKNILNKMKNARKSISFTKTFKNNIYWILQFALHGDNIWFYVKLLCLPFNIKSIQIKYDLIAEYNNKKLVMYNSNGQYWLSLNMDADRYKKGCKLLKPEKLAQINKITFKVKIYITSFKIVEPNGIKEKTYTF
eukprot:117435_1